MAKSPLLLTILILPIAPSLDDAGGLIASMDEMRFQAPKEGGSASMVDGKLGKAVHFRFEKDARVFFPSNIHGGPDWDRAAGFSFWVKGDGSDGFGGIEFIFDEDYAVRYDYCFPVTGTAWTKVVVAWNDLIPVLPGPGARPLGAPGGNPPSKLSGLWIGKWWYWGDYPATSFAIDEIRLEPSIARDPRDFRPSGPPLGRTLAKLRAGKPITVVTMGDSLTDKRHWSNREVAWVDLLKGKIKAKYGSEVAIVNPAIGGTQLRQNVILIPRWLAKAPEPDLVTIFFGGNDKEAGMTGDEFALACSDAVDRVRHATGGKSDVLLMTTIPSAPRWEGTADLASACRKAAIDRNAGLADAEKAILDLGRSDRNTPFVDDRVHLGRPGHEAVAEAVLNAIETAGR